MASRETGTLRESAILVVERGGKRVQVLQVILSELHDGRWQLFAQQLPRGGQTSTQHYATEEDARIVLTAYYAEHRAAGQWNVSRWAPRSAATDGKPHW